MSTAQQSQTRSRRKLSPGVFFDDVPEAQHDALRLVQHALDNLGYFVGCFDAGLRLFDASAKQLKTETREAKRGLLRKWQFVAARDGAMSIYHFCEAINAFRQSLQACPHIASKFDNAALKRAGKLLRSHFPNYERMRHSVGHAAEKTTNLAKHSQHGFTGTIRYGKRPFKVKGYVMIDSLQGRTFSNSWEGRIESYKISPATLKHLTAIKDILFDEFELANSRP